jgi:4-hydroxy-3-methylbut-2-enyl diphosphate reductase
LAVEPCLTRSTTLPARAGENLPDLKVLLAGPRGFCAGVRRAIDAVRDALASHGAPVYVRRAIVHNLEVVRELEAQGAIFVQELDEIPAGAVVLFSAHGVDPRLAEDASARGLIVYDAVCPLVSKVHREVRRHAREGRQIVLIGHVDHPEIIGTLGHVGSGTAFVVNCSREVDELPIHGDAPVGIAIQTTYAVDDAAEIIRALRKRFSDLVEPASSDICYATSNRQAAVRALAAIVDAVIVAGENFSSNATRLAEVATSECPSVQLIPGAARIDWDLLPSSGSIGITAAASTPEAVVQSIVAELGSRYSLSVAEFETMRETTVFKRLAIA